jgi:hypothetical protein
MPLNFRLRSSDTNYMHTATNIQYYFPSSSTPCFR